MVMCNTSHISIGTADNYKLRQLFKSRILLCGHLVYFYSIDNVIRNQDVFVYKRMVPTYHLLYLCVLFNLKQVYGKLKFLPTQTSYLFTTRNYAMPTNTFVHAQRAFILLNRVLFNCNLTQVPYKVYNNYNLLIGLKIYSRQ